MTDHEPHVSDLRWDRLLAGELASEERDAALAHAATCDACAVRHRELSALQAAFALPMPTLSRLPRIDGAATAALASTPVDELAAARARRRSRAMWLAPLSVAAAAAALVLVVGRRETTPSGELTKGDDGPALALSVEQAGRLVSLGAGDVVHPSDRLQATYSAQVDGFGAVIARDGAGTTSTYVPSSGDVMVKLPAATEAAFPESTILDDVTGTERIAIVWCAEARPLAPLVAAMRTDAPLAAPPGCHVRELALAKRASR